MFRYLSKIVHSSNVRLSDRPADHPTSTTPQPHNVTNFTYLFSEPKNAAYPPYLISPASLKTFNMMLRHVISARM